MRRIALATALLLGSVIGCGQFEAYRADAVHRFQTCRAWKRHSPSVNSEIRSSDFAAGWKQGYLDITSGGNGEAPLVPPEKYWGDRFRTASGHARINQWYAGYDSGAIAAEQDGAPQFAHIPVATGGPIAPPSIWNPSGQAPAWPEEIQPTQEEIQGTPVASSSEPRSIAAAPPAASAAPQAVAASPQPAVPLVGKIEEQPAKVASTPAIVTKPEHFAAAPPAPSAAPQAVAAAPQPAVPPVGKVEEQPAKVAITPIYVTKPEHLVAAPPAGKVDEQPAKVATTPIYVTKPKHLAATPSVRLAEAPVEAAAPQPAVPPVGKVEEPPAKVASTPAIVAKPEHLVAAPPAASAAPQAVATPPQQPAVPLAGKVEEQPAKVATTPIYVTKPMHLAATPSVRLAEAPVEATPPQQPAVPPAGKVEEQTTEIATTPIYVTKPKHLAATPSVRLAEPPAEAAPAVDSGKKPSAPVATKRRMTAAPNRLAVAAPSVTAPQSDEAKPSRLTMIAPIGIAQEPMAAAPVKVAAAPNKRIASRPTIAVKPRQSGIGAPVGSSEQPTLSETNRRREASPPTQHAAGIPLAEAGPTAQPLADQSTQVPSAQTFPSAAVRHKTIVIEKRPRPFGVARNGVVLRIIHVEPESGESSPSGTRGDNRYDLKMLIDAEPENVQTSAEFLDTTGATQTD